jgi:membrane protease YdiL (CAAX protease family)
MQTQPEVKIAALSFIAFWLITVCVIFVAGQYYCPVRDFKNRMISKWKPALVIAGLFIIGMGIGGSGFFNPYAIAIFCQALIGLAIASDIEDYQPLPVVDAFVQRRQILRRTILLIFISVLVVVPALLIGTVGLDIGRHLFGEPNHTREAANMLPPNKWLTFFLLFSGAGIAEETPYRLVVLSLIWKVTKRKWLAMILSALVFGAYHLTPLSGMYRVFWQFPISQFLASTLIGMIWGYLFIKRGYETTVLGHALSDWLPLMIFAG